MLRDALFQRVLSHYMSDSEALRATRPKLPSTSAIRILWWKKIVGRD